MAKIDRIRTGINYTVTRDDAEHVDIDIYGDIGDSWWDDNNVTAKEFLDLIRDADGKQIDLHINSAGGSVFDAYAMMAALRAHNGRVIAHVDGIAASAASYLIAAADEIAIARDAWMMIHNASGHVAGNAEDMRECAEWLDKIDDQIAGIYADRAEGSKDKDYYASAMAETTWYTAEDAVENGLADYIEDGVNAKDIAATMDAATLATAPDAVKPALSNGLVAQVLPLVTTAVAEPAVLTTDRADGQEPPADGVQEHFTRIGNRIINLNDYRNED